MIPDDFDYKDSRQYRYPRQCEGYYPDPESSPWAKIAFWIIGISFVALLLVGK